MRKSWAFDGKVTNQSVRNTDLRRVKKLIEAGRALKMYCLVLTNRQLKIVSEAPVRAAILVHVTPRPSDDLAVRRNAFVLNEAGAALLHS